VSSVFEAAANNQLAPAHGAANANGERVSSPGYSAGGVVTNDSDGNQTRGGTRPTFAQTSSWTPQRLVRPNGRSTTGWAMFRGTQIPFESALERDFLLQLLFNRTVRAVAAQPIRLKFLRDGRSYTYTPDFFVCLASGRSLLCEVKYRSRLRERWHLLRPAFRAACHYCRARSIRFSIVSEEEIRGSSLLLNAQFLRQFVYCTTDPRLETLICRDIAHRGTVSAGALLSSLRSEAPRGDLQRALWRLVAVGHVRSVLFVPLTGASPLWVGGAESLRWDPKRFRRDPLL
jgi:hypothetical protein